MEDTRRNTVQKQKPIKTEWSPQCVIFTYFQGDINSVVDEHFSRALSNVKNPQELSPLSQSEDVVLRKDTDMPPNPWRFSSPWTKPQPEASFANGATDCSMNEFGPMAMTQYPVPLPGSPSAQTGELWHFSSPASANSPEPEYPCAFSSEYLVPEAQRNEKHESLLNLLHQERYTAQPQQSAMWENCNSAHAAGSRGYPFNQPSNSAHSKKYFLPAHGPASASLARGNSTRK
ncbi:transcription cofactor vestigial-like protein 1 [Pteronotus mesoamericanus]|uniref:transcription cofactor vestigial-like protein 1 n=1 Tax=Pteronotus mesoamericanus TaxID=1884717 RepID=UPI0023EAC170|nr:transcription cofactor vestigial-like protein 1 [Pteronotus parnellii mesoamericanus]